MDLEWDKGSLVRTFLGVRLSGLKAVWCTGKNSANMQTYLSASTSSSSEFVVAAIARFLLLKIKPKK
jgi:hypothetical protein